MKMSAVLTLHPDKIIDTGEDGEEAVRILNPEKIIGVLTLDPGGDDAEMKMHAVPTLNPDKITYRRWKDEDERSPSIEP